MKKSVLLLLIPLSFVACTSVEEKQTTEVVQQDLKDENLQKYSEIGFHYAVTTKQALGKHLTEAIMEGGTEYALSFCHLQAIALTDSMSQLHNASITRVSDQPRNANNAANNKELEQIQYYKDLVAEGETGKEIQPNVEREGGKVYFYYPILTNEMCLQCHGTKNETINPEVLALLSELYPDDKATGYKSNEVRGIWSIIFNQ